MKKLMILTIALMVLLVGCSKKEVLIDNGGIEPTTDGIEKEAQKGEEAEESTEMEFDMVGEILEIRDGQAHILTGDIVQIYEVENAELEKFYLGETVSIKEIDGKNHMESYIIEGFDNQFTNMGQRIEEVTGKVDTVTETELTILTDEGVKKFELYNPIFAESGNEVTVAFIAMGEQVSLMDIYNETNKVSVTVKAIERNAETGAMLVSCATGEEVDYIATIADSRKNFNLSELKEGDSLDLYFEVMALSYPAQIAPKKVVKTN